MTNPTALVSKLWNYCSILRDDGLSYGDYVEQLTFLLFLKMADEQSRLRGTLSTIPKGKDWPSLLAKEGIERNILETAFIPYLQPARRVPHTSLQKDLDLQLFGARRMRAMT